MSGLIDLTHKRFGPNGDLYIDGRAEGSKNGMALWWVIHDIARGGCGLQRITDSRLAQLGTCPCRRGIAFKQQSRREKGQGRLWPLTDKGRAAIAEGNKRKRQMSKLPRTADGRVMKAGSKRGFGVGGGRRLLYGANTSKAQRHAEAAKAYRAKKARERAEQTIITGGSI